MAETTSRGAPIRMCVSCRETSEKRGLLRMVRSASGEAHIDPTGKAPGRGAYLCGAKECLKQALKGKKLGRALRCEISADLIRELEDRMLPTGADAERPGSGDKSYEC